MDPHINPATGVWDDNYYANTYSSANSILSGAVNSIAGYVNNVSPYPAFSFDEALAREASTKEYSPYYAEKLADYTTRVERTRTRSGEDLASTLSFLQGGKEYYEGTARRVLDLAIRKSGEGYAGSGLFFSGARERDKRLLEEETGLKMKENERQYQYDTSSAQLANKRTGEDVDLSQKETTRDLEREKKYAIEAGVLQRETEKLNEYTAKRADYYSNAGLYG